jgi:hypothetical protein
METKYQGSIEIFSAPCGLLEYLMATPPRCAAPTRAPPSANFLDSLRALSWKRISRIQIGEGRRIEIGRRGWRGKVGGYLGAVDGVGGDELVDVGVGPLGEGLVAAVDLLEVVEEGEVARPVLLHALEVLADPHRRRRRCFPSVAGLASLDAIRRRAWVGFLGKEKGGRN